MAEGPTTVGLSMHSPGQTQFVEKRQYVEYVHLAMRANALVVFPGGFGTLDELFELLTLKQTAKSTPIPIVLVDEQYWRGIVNFDRLAKQGMIDEADLRIFEFAADAESAWAALSRHELGSEALLTGKARQSGNLVGLMAHASDDP